MMMQQFLHATVLLGLCGTLASCVPPLPPGHNPNQTRENLSNTGTLCLLGQENYNVKVYYLPLDTTCASSSLHRWDSSRLTAVLTPQAGRDDAIKVESFITHVNNHSPVATADCAGAGVQTAQIAANSYRGFDVFWGARKIGGLANADGAILCKKVDATGKVTPMPQLHDEIRNMAKMDAFMGR